MAIQVVGAGYGRTGTYSLKTALERLLGAPCYHMTEVFSHPAHIPVWQAAVNGDPVDWAHLFDGYAAAVDWPVASFVPEVRHAFPDALVVLSARDPEAWWNSAHATIFSAMDAAKAMADWHAMVQGMFETRFHTDLEDRDGCIAAYRRHVDEVMETVPKDRLLVWRATDGWEPLCRALEVPTPAEPFPVTNTTEEFLARINEHLH